MDLVVGFFRVNGSRMIPKPRHLTNYCLDCSSCLLPTKSWNSSTTMEWIMLLIFWSCSGRNAVFCDVVVLADHLHSMAFLIYMFIVYLIHLYTTSGRNAANRKSENIEMSRSAWYSRVGNVEVETLDSSVPFHVIGDDDDNDNTRITLSTSRW